MKRVMLVLLATLPVLAFVLVACDDEPTQEEANEQFCDDISELVASMRVLEDLNANSTIEEVEDARERARNAYADVLESAVGVVEASLDDLRDAYDDLQAAVDAIDDESTLAEALDEVDDELANVAAESSKVLNDVDCRGPGSDSQSDE